MPVTRGGAAHRLLVPDEIAAESLYRLKHELIFPRLVSREYEKYFANKIGDSISIKKPFYVPVNEGREITDNDIYGLIDYYTTLKVSQRYNVPLAYNDEDLTLDINSFGARYLKAAAEGLAYKYDIAGLAEVVPALFIADGTPGTAITTDLVHNIRAHAEEMAIPMNRMNYGVLSPRAFPDIKKDIEGLDLVRDRMVEQAVRERFQGILANWRLFSSVHIPHFKVRNLVQTAAPLIQGATQRGSSLTTDGWGNHSAARKVLYKGQLIQIAGVYEITPRGHQELGKLKTFTVTEDAEASAAGVATVKVSPQIIDEDATVQSGDGSTNLSAKAFRNVSAIPADNAAITVVGWDSGSGASNVASEADLLFHQGIFFEKSCATYANVVLAEMETMPVRALAYDEQTNLSITLTKDGDIRKMTETTRLDTYFGVGCIYPDVGIRAIFDKVRS